MKMKRIAVVLDQKITRLKDIPVDVTVIVQIVRRIMGIVMADGIMDTIM